MNVAAAIYCGASATDGGCATAAAVSWKRLSAACSTAVGACASLPAMVAVGCLTEQSVADLATYLPSADAAVSTTGAITDLTSTLVSHAIRRVYHADSRPDCEVWLDPLQFAKTLVIAPGSAGFETAKAAATCKAMLLLIKRLPLQTVCCTCPSEPRLAEYQISNCQCTARKEGSSGWQHV